MEVNCTALTESRTHVKAKAKDMPIKDKARDIAYSVNAKVCADVLQSYYLMCNLSKNVTNWHNDF